MLFYSRPHHLISILATSIGEISPPRKSFINDDENVSGNRSSEVRERVRQIMETRNSPCRTQVGHSDSHVGSPRLQDLWITTNENLTPSPGNSPPGKGMMRNIMQDFNGINSSRHENRI